MGCASHACTGTSVLHGTPIGRPTPAVLPLDEAVGRSACKGVQAAAATNCHRHLMLLPHTAPCVWRCLQVDGAAGFQVVCRTLVNVLGAAACRAPRMHAKRRWVGG